jgi:hypothetical protein
MCTREDILNEVFYNYFYDEESPLRKCITTMGFVIDDINVELEPLEYAGLEEKLTLSLKLRMPPESDLELVRR